MSPVWISPDCTYGKHTACSGEAFDDYADDVTDCQCDCHD